MNFILTIVEITLFWIVIAFLELHNITYSVSNNFNINADNGNNGLEEPYNSGNNFYKILNNLDGKNFNKLNGEFSKKRNAFHKIPWIALSANSFIQFLMFIFILIIRGRIKRKSDFGFWKSNNNRSSERGVVYNSYSRKKAKNRNSKKTKKENTDANSENFEFKNKKKIKKRRGSKKYKY